MLSSSHYRRTIQFTLSCSLYSVSVQRPARHPSYTIHLIFDSPLHPKHYMGHPSLSFARFCDTSVSCYFHLSGSQSLLLLIHFRYSPNTC